MKIKTLVSRIALLALLSTLNPQLSTAFAQGTAFSYQGRLNDGANPAQGIYDLRFTIYDALANGNAVTGVLTNAATPVTNGLFTVALDFGPGAFTGDARWLDIAVRTNGAVSFTTLSPRQPLTPSPYALYAPNAGVAATAGTAAIASSVSGTVAASQLTGTISSNQIAPASITAAMLAAGSVTASSLADGAVSFGKLATLLSASLSTTFTNPTPAANDYFGYAVAAVGTDMVLIGAQEDDTGAPNTGAAYLFDATGTLLTTFTNPTPAPGDRFGIAVAGVGSDKVLIGAFFDDTGAPNAGAAYLFSTNGTLLTTFTNPTPATNEYFGYALAAVGTDEVLIGAYRDSTGAPNTGAAYLFSTNGTLITTFTNPTPAANDFLGIAVAAVGTDKVLIGAEGDDTGAVDAGAAYLFSTNGTLLTTFTNPAPHSSDVFGHALTAVGAEKVLIGAYMKDNAGAAYLFSTNGTLLTTFTNPAPVSSYYFGIAVATVGTDKVLIGAEAADAGAAYLFSTSGKLLSTLTNPNPTPNSYFGYAVAALGTDTVLIGANRDNTGATAAGAAYLFRLNTYVPGLGVADRAITAASLADGAVGSAQIAAGAVDATKIASGAVGSAQLAAGAVTSTALAAGAVTADKLFRMPALFSLLTLTNPTPENYDEFGCTVAAFGSDRLLVGAFRDNVPGAGGAGAAYLFGLTGNLLTTFTNPIPAGSDYFGSAVAAVGNDRVLIGAYGDDTGAPDAGAAYLFSTNGTLLATFTNPTPANEDFFGWSVAGVGSDRVLIGAYQDDTGATDAGAAYLFSTNGTLLATFTNPAPAAGDFFGYSLTAVGNDRVLIGAYAANRGAPGVGAAYLFDLAGNLITTISNPTPGGGDFFGFSVAAVGTNRMVIGAYSDNANAVDAGAAYLFDLTGNLVTTFTNPTPVIAENFGYAVSAFRNDRVLIGTYGNALGARAAYVFDLAGNLLTTLNNPSPAVDDGFSHHLAGVGTDRVAVGAQLDDTGATDTGVAYLFTLRDFAPGLLADGVRPGAINTISLADGAVTQTKLAAGAVGSGQLAADAVQAGNIAAGAITTAKLDATIGVWSKSGSNISFIVGNVGIGTDTPATRLDVAGTVTAAGFKGNGAGLTNLNWTSLATPPPGMVLIPADSFTMGNSIGDSDINDANPTNIYVSAFYMDVNLVSWSQWQSVYFWATNHGYGFVYAGAGKAANHPVQTVDWYDCVKWCNARSQQAGKTPVYYTDGGFTQVYTNGQVTVYANWAAQGYRLPTEAEWEKAARGGLSGQRFPWGNVINQNLANYYGATASYSYDLGPDGYNLIGSIGGTSPATSPVGSFAANGYGLYDMAGNVFAWCWDWYGTPYAGGSDPRGPASGSNRVLRGGLWSYNADVARCAFRNFSFPDSAGYGFGFRCVRGL